MILLAGVSSLFVGNAFQAQMPEYAHDLGADDAGVKYSALLGANAAGAVVGGLLLEGRSLFQPRARTAILCAIVWCLIITGFAASTSYPLSLVLLFFGGVTHLTFSAMAQTLVQLLAPADLRGRLVGLYNMSSNVLGSVIGIHWSLALSALMLLAVMPLLLGFSTRTR
jgi:sugar phosphate permease